MATTIVVTRNAPARHRGFLASCMLEIAPGVYLAPRMKKAVRERVWSVMLEWLEVLPENGGIVMFWPAKDAPSGLGMRFLGWPSKTLVEHEGIWLARGTITAYHDPVELEEIKHWTPDPIFDTD